ncbi:type I restriction-modification system endonuclease [Pelagicoccus mobilis]|uniref:Type I restriction-modification system endonuclease n=1 Tax=Pelagicoccus mobilis TaxID=415221 RepID=A0A934RUN6_9BACT|nr:type I restriction-modification system endonuclease [Pelagicoccus mobilis]MBK1877975.1 type I restriction-modification system endonuclease [Pelagicoccus mobilis]
MSVPPPTVNFQFLRKSEPHLLKLASGAESYCFVEPDLSLTRSRQFAEAIAALILQSSSQHREEIPDLLKSINALRDEGYLSRELCDAFHTIRKLGNKAVHTGSAKESSALHALKLTRAIAVWYHRLSKPNFKPGAFIPPPPPEDPTEELANELAELREKFAEEHKALEQAEAQIGSLEAAREAALEEARKAYEEQAAALDLAAETEEKLLAAQEAFLSEEAKKPAPTKKEAEETKSAANQASSQFLSDLDEAETREIIDAKLREAGWEADTVNIRYARGTRPEKGVNKAIAEWPTTSGPVDYALFVGLQLIAVAEAKKFEYDLPPVLGQARRYAKDIDSKGFALPEGSPWFEYKVPFAFASNGRPYLKQIEEKSGIYFQDLRDETFSPCAIDGWRSPEGLVADLKQDIAEANEDLSNSPVDDLPGLRDYQIEAISEIEKCIARGQRELLLAMATGTGKTRTAVSLIYRLIRYKRFRRILFLVDREKLGEQAHDDGFANIKLESLQTFTDMYNVAELGDRTIEPETKVHIATVQSMVQRVTHLSDDPPPPVDQYDCIIIDECHRGYNLDREMDEHEMAFRSEADFISKYRRVIEHFHAVKIGLTATPAAHTTDIFGRPVYTYSYREAVTDGHLCDHEPPYRFTTALAKHGIKWRRGEKIQFYDPKTGEMDLVTAPDEVLKGVDEFNKQVITRPFNTTICEEIASPEYFDPSEPGKTLVFCATDSHADIFVTELKKAIRKQYGPQPDNLVAKITGTAVAGDSTVYKRFKNEVYPKIAVTVDLLTTGVDIPAITRLVFVRRVKSRILYEQMLGRATRQCRDLFGEGEHKQSFEIFDAVDIYDALEDFSTMRPVVQRPKASIPQIVGWMDEALAAENATSAEAFHRELVVRIRRLGSRLAGRNEELESRFPPYNADTLTSAIATSPSAASAIFDKREDLADWLAKVAKKGPRPPLMVSEHTDEILSVERGYGDGREKPADYLDRFNHWIDEHKTTNEALRLVLTAPASLDRKALKQLLLALADEGFSETQLRPAWREVKHQDCAATLIGYIRSQALGSPLIPFEERVERAAQQLRSSTEFQWTQNQRRWLDRIVNQIKKQTLVDRDSLQSGAFASAGGFNVINKSFSGKLDRLLSDLHSAIWSDDVA